MNNIFKFQVISDIHSEIKPFNLDTMIPKCDNLFLAGDIGKPGSNEYRKILKHSSTNWKNVFVIAGNHEFYKNSYKKTIEIIENDVQEYKNIYFLNKNSVILNEYNPNIKIMGCTLWSKIPENLYENIENHINDYHLIRDCENNYKKINASYTNKLHENQVEWLTQELNNSKYKNIVITHHAPSFNNTFDYKYKGKITNYAFCTDLENLFKNVEIWIFGHTHYNTDIKIENTRLISNQYGYSQIERVGFNFEKIYTID